MIDEINHIIQERFPQYSVDTTKSKTPANRIFGNRFLKDQTVMEYLTEFLLVFKSPKELIHGKSEGCDFPDISSLNMKDGKVRYYPDSGLLIKFFSFFAISKLDTRHDIHRKYYQQALKKLKDNINGKYKEDSLSILQNLLVGFIGVAKNRTWCAYTFMPANSRLLFRELNWEHSKTRNKQIESWEESQDFYDPNRHMFMARGGELVYLQLLNFFNNIDSEKLRNIKDRYYHLEKLSTISNLPDMLSKILSDYDDTIGQTVDFLQDNLSNEICDKQIISEVTCDWVPQDTIIEASLLAWEMFNICLSNEDTVSKLEMLELLVALHVLRTMCFQSSRMINNVNLSSFEGNYAWFPDMSEEQNIQQRKISEESYNKIENLLFKIVRYKSILKDKDGNIDDDGFKLFRFLGKQIELIVPKVGAKMRFNLSTKLVKLFVVTLIKPGERIRFDEFLKRLYLHFGIAISGTEYKEALKICFDDKYPEHVHGDTIWLQDILQRAGYIVLLSDSVAMVTNPYSRGR